ncbi:MAG: transcriptional regulator [Alphaproteobacteria bacterium PA2]|nr:MAG: transcriptional regulator [Alphaproteobacteria bacterium PA2]
MLKPPPITNRVRELREQAGGMSQAALADAIGVTRQTVIAIEQGRYSPSLESAFRISRVFGVGVEDVFGWQSDGRGAPSKGTMKS